MFSVALIQVLVLSLAGILIGLVAAAALPPLAVWLLRDLLPVPPVLGLYPAPLVLAAVYGLLTALGFALLPLGRAARIPGGALFRDGLLPERVRPAPWLLAATADVGGLALVGLTIATAADCGFALWFCAAALGTQVLVPTGRFRPGAAGPPGATDARVLGPPTLHRAAPRRRCCWSGGAWSVHPGCGGGVAIYWIKSQNRCRRTRRIYHRYPGQPASRFDQYVTPVSLTNNAYRSIPSDA